MKYGIGSINCGDALLTEIIILDVVLFNGKLWKLLSYKVPPAIIGLKNYSGVSNNYEHSGWYVTGLL